MSDTSTELAVVDRGEQLDPATARHLAARWKESGRLAMTSILPKSITHHREKRGGNWVDVENDPAVVRATVFAVVRYGELFGFPPAVALGKIDVIEGRMEARYDALNGLMQDAGHQVRIKEASAERAIVAVRRAEDRDDPTGWQEVTFTAEEALHAGYIKREPEARELRGAWYTRRADMLVSKAIKRACRWITPDVLIGGDTREGHTPALIEGAPVEQFAPPAQVSSPSAPTSQREEEVRHSAPPEPEGDDIIEAEIVDAGSSGAVGPPVDDPSTLDPGEDVPPASPGSTPLTDPQRRKLLALLKDRRNATTRADRLAVVSELVGWPVGSSNDLTVEQASHVIDALEAEEPWGDPDPEEAA